MLRAGNFTMQFVARDDWRTSTVTRMVAVLAALGVPVTTERVWRDRQGDERVTFLHGPASVHAWRSGLPLAKRLVKLWKAGTLATKDPQHPLLDGLRVIEILLALRVWIKTGQAHERAVCARDRCLLVPGTVEPRAGDIVRTANAYRTAALVLLGFPLFELQEPQRGTVAFTLGNVSPFDVRATAGQLITDHKAGMLEKVHPFAFAVEVARTYDYILKHISEEIMLLMFRARGEPRFAFVREDASDRAKLITDRFISGED